MIKAHELPIPDGMIGEDPIITQLYWHTRRPHETNPIPAEAINPFSMAIEHSVQVQPVPERHLQPVENQPPALPEQSTPYKQAA